MDKFESDIYTIPFNIKPFKSPLYLDDNTAKNAMTVGFVGIIAPVLFILSTLDPWANMFLNLKKIDFYEYGLFFLIIVTAFIAYKQWGYYYWTEAGGKRGIFKGIVKQVNSRERDLDFILAISGALLLAFAALPVIWFLALAIYSFLVALRCYFTLRRKKYAAILINKGTEVPIWYTQALDETWNDLVVKQVLAGWIASHVAIFIYSIILFNLFILNFADLIPIMRIIFLVFAIAGIILLYFGLSVHSYRWGSKICNWMGV